MKLSRIFVFLLLFAALTGCARWISRENPPENCADCHGDSSAFKEWQCSDHADSLENLRDDPLARSKCLECHSADYRRVKYVLWIFPTNLPAPKTASDSVSCSSCHEHDTEIEHNLIVSADQVCLDCHVMLCGT
jgi:hypothetical protein